MKRAVLLFSGGMDSFLAGFLAEKKVEIHALSFNYGQRNTKELEAAEKLAKGRAWNHYVQDIRTIFRSTKSALLQGQDGDLQEGAIAGEVTSFVPNRNLIFAALAHSFALEIDADYIISGLNQDPHSFPDAREEFCTMQQKMLNMGSESFVEWLYPLKGISRARAYEIAHDTGCLNEVMESYSCYDNGDVRYSWGEGCGICMACKARDSEYKKAFPWQI